VCLSPKDNKNYKTLTLDAKTEPRKATHRNALKIWRNKQLKHDPQTQDNQKYKQLDSTRSIVTLPLFWGTKTVKQWMIQEQK